MPDADRNAQLEELERLAKSAQSGRRASIDRQIEALKQKVSPDCTADRKERRESIQEEPDGDHDIAGASVSVSAEKDDGMSDEVKELERLKASTTSQSRRKSIDMQIDALKGLANKEDKPLFNIGETSIGEGIAEDIGDDANAEISAQKENNFELQELERLASTAHDPKRRKSIDDKISALVELERARQEEAGVWSKSKEK